MPHWIFTKHVWVCSNVCYVVYFSNIPANLGMQEIQITWVMGQCIWYVNPSCVRFCLYCPKTKRYNLEKMFSKRKAHYFGTVANGFKCTAEAPRVHQCMDLKAWLNFIAFASCLSLLCFKRNLHVSCIGLWGYDC